MHIRFRFTIAESLSRIGRVLVAFNFLLGMTFAFSLVRPAFAQTVTLQDTVAPDAKTMTPVGHADPSKMLNLDIRFALRNRAEMDRLMAEQMRPGSPNYQKWITPEEFSRRFGPTTEDFDAVQKWLTDNGFHVSGGSQREGYLRVSGDVATAERAFNTRIEDFGNGKFGNIKEPQIPARFADTIADIVGLHNLAHLQPAYRLKKETRDKLLRKARPHRTSSGGGPQFNLGAIGDSGFTFAAPDFYTFYDENPAFDVGATGNNGSDCIGIFGATSIFNEPITEYSSCAQSEADGQVCIIYDYFSFFSQYTSLSTDPELTKEDAEPNNDVFADFDGEAYLDIEWSHVAAPGAPITLYIANPATDTEEQWLTDALGLMVDDNRCGALNFSYSNCGSAASFYTRSLGNLVTQAQMQGQSIFVSSGDRGADMCGEGKRNVNEFSANPLITSVGGTGFDPTYNDNGFATGYVSEFAWNDETTETEGENTVTGGGVSSVFTKPTWQQGVPGTSNDKFRDVPDVANIASADHPGVIITEDTDVNGTPQNSETVTVIGGTSLASPVWAGISRVLQQVNNGVRLGSLNPRIWQMGVDGQAANGFHDVTQGNNTYVSIIKKKPVTVQGYSAVPGYDLATGWGTIDISEFIVQYLTPPPPTPTELSASPASINFGTVDATAVSRARTINLTNTGTVAAAITQVSAPAPFVLSTDECSNQSIAPRKRCTVGLEFAPSTPTVATGGAINVLIQRQQSRNGPERYRHRGHA